MYEETCPADTPHATCTAKPLTDAVREAGALGAAEQAAPTGTVTSLDGALSPEPLVARTRTKYVPAATFVAISVVGEGLVGKRPMLEAPAADPASTT